MRNLWSIAKKELGLYFRSPVGYVVFFIFLLIWGFFFVSAIRWFNDYSLQAAQNPYYAQQLNINLMVLAPTFQNITIFFLLLLPALTMRLFAEEKKLGTDELLYTSPLSVGQIVGGKYLASLIMLAVMLALSVVSCLFTFIYGNPEIAPLLVGYLGLFLMGAAFMAVGLFFSALTESQVVAVIVPMGLNLMLYILSWAAYSASGLRKEVLDYLSFLQHFDGMVRGVLDTKDIVYFLSFCFFWLFLTHSVIQSRRWR
ncbi:MAG: ABC transporter permease subunit [Candidatus Aminicenantales bacterium]|jgi:ABC-2 type transport system permease protein